MERSLVSKAREIASASSERAVLGTAFLPVEVPWNAKVQAVIVIAGAFGIVLVNKFVLNPTIKRARENQERGEVK